jgi:hypothetical protein
MSKTTASAAGGAAPADHPDAALFAMAEECIVASRERDKVFAQMNVAEEKHNPIPTPEPVLKSQQDAQRGLFLGDGIGKPYDEVEIAAIRVFCRRVGRSPDGDVDPKRAYFRAMEILRAWADWQDAIKAEEERSGLVAANAAYRIVQDKFDAVAGALAKTPAATIEGVLAKTRAFLCVFTDDDAMASNIRDELRDFGADEDVAPMSLARDLIRLVKSEGAAQ